MAAVRARQDTLYNSIVTCKLWLACLLAISSTLGQTAQKQQQPAKPTSTQPTPTQPQPPDETNPPEEDASVAPKTYAFDPLEAQRCINIGNFYFKKGTKGYRAALGRYEDATKYDPNSAEAFLKVGEVEEKLNNKGAAKIAFERTIKLAPDSKFAKEAHKKLGS
jgi:tetratricopeptide (TPR) repeat protein